MAAEATVRIVSRCAGRRGFALIFVLWTVALLAVLATSFVRNAHGDLLLVRNREAQAVAEAAADGALMHFIGTLVGLARPQWLALEAAPFRYQAGGIEATIALHQEGRKLALNSAEEAELALLLSRYDLGGVSPQVLAARIRDWSDRDDVPRAGGAEAEQYRAAAAESLPANRPFIDVEELFGVLGMPTRLVPQLRTVFSVHGGARTVDQLDRPPVAGSALTQAAPVTVRSDVTIDGTRFVREATLWIFPASDRPVRFLRWRRIYPEIEAVS